MTARPIPARHVRRPAPTGDIPAGTTAPALHAAIDTLTAELGDLLPPREIRAVAFNVLLAVAPALHAAWLHEHPDGNPAIVLDEAIDRLDAIIARLRAPLAPTTALTVADITAAAGATR